MTTNTNKEKYFSNAEDCVDEIVSRLNKKICVGIGCGVGKPVNFINALYLKAKKDPEIELTIISALTLEKPKAQNDLQRRLMDPMMERIFEDGPDFEHVLDLRKNAIPKNIKLYEWMLPPGGYVMHDSGQRVHVASNFSDAPRDILSKDINIICQMAGSEIIDGKRVITSAGNSDVINALIEGVLKGRETSDRIIMAEVNTKAPFLWTDALQEPSFFDYILEGENFNQQPFCPPKEAISETNHMMGFYSSLLVKDGGTLQVGIGSLGDAITNGILMRHKHNDMYRKIIKKSNIMSSKNTLLKEWGGDAPFEEGLFCDSEMFVDSFLDLYDEGIIKRKVYDDYTIQKLLNEKRITEDVDIQMVKELYKEEAIGTPLRKKEFENLQKFGILKNEVKYSKEFLSFNDITLSTDLDKSLSDDSFKDLLGDKLLGGEVVHATIMISPKGMYKRLEEMSQEEKKVFSLRNIKFVNTLNGEEDLKAVQRKDGRFMNFTLVATLTGAVASETIKNQQVISGIGGQLDFITMANALDDGRSILILNAIRGEGKSIQSNIVFEYSGCSASRQLRDIIITEYGIADLQGCNDEECAIEMIKIADSRFQDSLLAEAKKYKKISKDYVLPEEFRNNYPEKITEILGEFKKEGFFEPFPFGSDLTDEEFQLGLSLKGFLVQMNDNKINTILKVVSKLFAKAPENFQKHIERMDLVNPKSFSERFSRAVVITALKNQFES